MKPRRQSLRTQMAAQYALVTLVTGLVFVAVNFGVVERNTTGLTDALVGVGVITLVAVGAGWGIAHYALRPLRVVTATAQQVSATSLHQRIGLIGPNDELQQLAATFDSLLARLEASFERERRFVANASHEIRTPLAVTRTSLELGLAARNPTVDELREVIAQALEATGRTETLAADLLLLAQSENGTTAPTDQFDLGELVGEVINDLANKATAAQVSIVADLDPAPMEGAAGLVDRLIVNLVNNAIRHNSPGGWVEVTTKADGGCAILTVRNHTSADYSGPVEELFEPFHRGGRSPAHTIAAGHGLGLSIVKAIAVGHDASLDASFDLDQEVFRVSVRFQVV